MRKLLSLAVIPLLATACVVPDDGYVRTDTTPSVAFDPGHRVHQEQGLWGTQPIVPPAGLVTVRQGNLIGRTVSDGGGTEFLWIEYLLADPLTGDARYAICSSNQFGEYVAVPLSVMRITPYSVQLDASARTVALMPKYSRADLDRRYPRTALSAPIGLPPLAPALPPVATAIGPPAEALQLVRRGSVVGYPVFDAAGQSVGTVDAVSAVPVTGEVRYAIISSPTLGFGTYIAVPATGLQSAGGRVIVPGASANWMQAPRYRGDQVQQMFGSLGTVN